MGLSVGVMTTELSGDLSHYFANTDNKYSEYLTICSRIKKQLEQTK